MAWAALVVYVVYLGLAFGLRTIVHVRRTGSTGFHGVRGRMGSLEWLAGVGFVVALLLGIAAPVLDVLGVAMPIAAIDGATINGAGLALALAGIAGTLIAQLAMERRGPG